MLTDMLNRPISVGDTVLTKSYGSTSYAQFTVTKVARVNIYVTMPQRQYVMNTSTQRWEIDRTPKSMARAPSEVIVINEQLAYNREQWPENYL